MDMGRRFTEAPQQLPQAHNLEYLILDDMELMRRENNGVMTVWDKYGPQILEG